MIEWLISVPVVMGGVALAQNRNKMTDKKKIKTMFETLGIGVPNKNKEVKYPKFISKDKIEDNDELIGYKYVYSLPLGIPSKSIKKLNENSEVFKDGLGKSTVIEFENGYLYIKVFEKDIPKSWDFKEVKLKPNTWKVPLGKTFEGIEWYDFDKRPHMVNGGSTGFGKSVLLKMMMTSLILQNPEDAQFYIIDLKGGLEFSRYKNLKQVKGVASTPDEALKMLGSIDQLEKGEGEETLIYDMFSKMQYFKQKNWSNIVDTPLKKRTFIIVDEAHELVSDKWMKKGHKDSLDKCMHSLQAIAALGRGLGYRLLYCTQYPTSDSCPKNIKQNSTLRISFKLPDPHASQVILDTGEASEIPELEGRAIMKTSSTKEIQVPYIKDNEMWELLKKYEVKEEPKNEQHHSEKGETIEDFELPR